ncbi:MAG: lipoprotein [Comamonadaceae bacterium]
MLRHRQILVSALVLGLGVVTLSACGQQGALYLPSGPDAEKPSPAAASSPAKAPATGTNPAPP